MAEYFIRRLLLAIPTFFISTFIVFTIVRETPGSPLDRAIMELKMSAATEGAASSNSFGGSGEIPEEALEELKRFYGYDRPIWRAYLDWLGVMPRQTVSYKLTEGTPRNIGDGVRAIANIENGNWVIRDYRDQDRVIDTWTIDTETKVADNGDKQVRIFKEERSGILQLDFGKSHEYRQTVLELVKERLPISLQFGIIGLLLSYTVCVYLGILKALNHGSAFDLTTSVLVFVGYSIPGWALGAVLLVMLGGGSFYDVFPLGGFQSDNYETLSFFGKVWDHAYHFVLPTIAYTIASFASLTMLMKNSLLENLSQDYIRTAFAKGLREKRVIWIHAMRNSIIPLASRIGFIVALFLASSYLIELVFNIDGLGMLTFRAILARDFPIVFGFAVISVIIQLVGTMLSDLALSVVNPRIRFK